MVDFHKQLTEAADVPQGLLEDTAAKAESAEKFAEDPLGAKALNSLLSPVLEVPGNNGRKRNVIGNVYSKIFADYFTDTE